MEKMIETALKGIGFFLIVLVVGVPFSLMGAWPVMLALGVLHNDVSTHVPALGFWATAIVLWGIGAVTARVQSQRRPS